MGTWRALLRVAMGAFCFLSVMTLSSAQTVYKFTNSTISFSPYAVSILTLSSVDGVVSGRLQPLQGDNTPSVEVTGTNDGEETLRLKFNYPSGEERYTCSKRIPGPLDITEFSTSGGRQAFWRHTDSSFSEAALTFTEYPCGIPYKVLDGEIRPSVSVQMLDSFFRREPLLASVPVTGESGVRSSLQDYLRKTVVGKKTSLYFSTPFGADTYVAKTLRMSNLFSKLDHTKGGCGSSERGTVTVRRERVFNTDGFSVIKFREFSDEILSGLARVDGQGRSWNYRLSQKAVLRLNVPPFTSAYRVKMYAASETTRREPGLWDSFYVSLEPGELPSTKENDYAILVTVEHLFTSKRSAGNSTPPSDPYFTAPLSFQEEGVVTTSILNYFASHGG
jgi:hypothetical protein